MTMTGNMSGAFIGALAGWAARGKMMADVQLDGIEVFEVDTEQPTIWNRPTGRLRQIQERTTRYRDRDWPKRVLAYRVIQGDDGCWIDEQGNVYDYDEDGKKIILVASPKVYTRDEVAVALNKLIGGAWRHEVLEVPGERALSRLVDAGLHFLDNPCGTMEDLVERLR